MRVEIFLAERKTVENGQNYDKENSNCGINDQTIVIENCKHVISEVSLEEMVSTNTEIFTHKISI